ncbi:hypothetical protein LTR36_007604 [Oleoguttula mirabilis]|uniref:Uncharacterized protein n=1 Tax=Oleoguttula mirabilis TaxID=1507867 RepID=A0AAV9JU31_9PEZI|nr:hypothetical protein LTR36_007604 [Oleoguttula mirabilis]
MATVANGTLTPPTATEPTPTTVPSDTSANKRKREDEPDQHPVVNGAQGSPKSKQTQRDILDILQQYDTSPSFLTLELDDTLPNGASQPPQKKARISAGSGKTTISAKLSNGAYPVLSLLKDDAARVGKVLETSLRANAREAEALNAGRLSVDDLKQIQRAKAFEGLICEVVDKESRYQTTHTSATVKRETAGLTNGHVMDTKTGADSRMGTVLTLFGNAPTPKQLFSSTQNVPVGKQDRTIKSELPVEEMSLPNGLTATKIMPAPADSKKGPTFEEAFAPPYSLASLHPPKVHKRSSTRDTTITWEFKDPVNRSSKKGGYTVQSLTTGDWLGYGGVDSVTDASAKEKRKQRDRALSSGAESVKEVPSKTSLEELQAKDEEALFRRAYGSFAPSVDNAKSVLPAETTSMVWWSKVGEKRFSDTFAIDPALLDESSADAVSALPAAEVLTGEEENFEHVVKELDDLDEDMAKVDSSMSKTDVEQVLREVSELLETLASHQRIRSATLPSATAASRTPISPAPLLASRIGKPDEPAEDEVSTYHALRRELAYLILKLPPYAVAKIDGDQLADLGVSALIPFESKDIKGTMEEDQIARLAKYNAMASAAGVASLTRGSSSSGQHYSTTAQRTPAIGQAANTRYGQTPQYSTTRTPAAAPQFQRSTSNQSQYGTPSAAAPRPAYGQQPNQYTRPGAPQQAYSQSNGYYQQQRPPQAATPSVGGYAGYNQQYSHQQQASTPQTQPRPTYSTSQPLAQYQQRSHAAAANAVAYQTNAGSQAAQQQQQQTMSPFNRTSTVSPATAAKPVVYGQQPTQPQAPLNVQPRPVAAYPSQAAQQYAAQQLSGSGSGRATPAGFAAASASSSQPPTPVNGFQPRPPPPPPSLPAATVRAASGTPQPAAAGLLLAQQMGQGVQANGHL